jgi:hypothetical protein
MKLAAATKTGATPTARLTAMEAALMLFGGPSVDDPRTLAEALDAAQDGAQFGQVIQGLFSALEAAIDARL